MAVLPLYTQTLHDQELEELLVITGLQWCVAAVWAGRRPQGVLEAAGTRGALIATW